VAARHIDQLSLGTVEPLSLAYNLVQGIEHIG
jgi:hypothetical protein